MQADLEVVYDGSIKSWLLKYSQLKDTNTIRYKGVYVGVVKSRDTIGGARDATERYVHSYRLKAFLGENILQAMMEEVRSSWAAKNTKDTGLRAVITDTWRSDKIIHINPYKTLDKVFIDNKDLIVDDIKNFLVKKDLYAKNGVKFKRSYLLYGRPGGGKTSLVFAVAHWLKRPIYYLNPDGFAGDSQFESFVSNVPEESVVLIEDVDIFWTNRDDSSSKISFQSLLNVLDGLHSPNNVLIFMTTNHPENFDEAFMRKGRMDFKLKIEYPSKEMVEAYIANFYDLIEPVALDKYDGLTPMTEIQDICIKNSFEEALDKINEL
jgi:chaperone BCS1